MTSEIPDRSTQEQVIGLRTEVEQRLAITKEEMNRFADPANIEPETVFAAVQDEVRLESDYPGKLSPEQMLVAIDRFEQWYLEKGIDLPNKEYIGQIRDYWKQRGDGSAR